MWVGFGREWPNLNELSSRSMQVRGENRVYGLGGRKAPSLFSKAATEFVSETPCMINKRAECRRRRKG